MSVAKEGKPNVLAALVLTYAADLRGWLAGRATVYGIALGLFIAGALSTVSAIVVGLIALFHFIEFRYGVDVAFAVLGGGLLAFALILFLAGWAMLRRRATPVPRPYRQARAARQMLFGSTVARTVAAFGEGARPDPITQVLLGTAVVLVAGWILSANLTSPKKVQG